MSETKRGKRESKRMLGTKEKNRKWGKKMSLNLGLAIIGSTLSFSCPFSCLPLDSRCLREQSFTVAILEGEQETEEETGGD